MPQRESKLQSPDCHVSHKGQQSSVHTQLSQLQSLQETGKAVSIWNSIQEYISRTELQGSEIPAWGSKNHSAFL